MQTYIKICDFYARHIRKKQFFRGNRCILCDVLKKVERRVGVYIVFTSETVGLLIFGKVEGILIIPLEKWKFVHKLRWKKGCGMLNRKIDSYLKDYYQKSSNALLITGARQVGKTYSIREFGKTFKSFIEINFIENPDVVGLFKDAKGSADILMRLSTITNVPMIKGDTLIFFDEVQECPNIVTAIKFLVDEGSYRYILSGSLLGVELKDIRSVPVGYMGVKEMFPLDFEEFITC